MLDTEVSYSFRTEHQLPQEQQMEKMIFLLLIFLETIMWLPI